MLTRKIFFQKTFSKNIKFCKEILKKFPVFSLKSVILGAKLTKISSTIFVCDFWYFSLMVPFFVAEFFAQSSIPYLLQNFRTFLKWYHFCLFFSHFAQIGSTVFKATFCIGTFWHQKVKRGLNPLKPPSRIQNLARR